MTIKHFYDKLFTTDYVLAYNINNDSDIDNLRKKLNKYFKEDIKLEYLGENRGYCDQIETKNGLVVIIVLKNLNNTPFDQSTLAHECFHATKFALEHKGIKLCDTTEEVFAYNIDMLMNVFLEEKKRRRSSYLKSKIKSPKILYGRKVTQAIIRKTKQTGKRT